MAAKKNQNYVMPAAPEVKKFNVALAVPQGMDDEEVAKVLKIMFAKAGVEADVVPAAPEPNNTAPFGFFKRAA